MQLGIVIGNLWSTRKEDRLTGMKLMLVKPINVLKEDAVTLPLVAVDTIGAGIGETVIFVTGSSARTAIKDMQAPMDTAIVGIVDHYDVDKRYL